MEFPYPLIVCDIGGTNIRIGWVAERDAAPLVLAKRKTADFPGFTECIEQVLGEAGLGQPRSLVACGAGPVSHRRLHLTNAAWTIDGPQTAYRLGLSQGLLLNDFEAQALSIPAHKREWLRTIGPAISPDFGPRIILGPGTGLGVAALIVHNGCHLALASEAAHADFAPATAEDWEVWPLLDRVHGRITAETILSGPGLARLHRARGLLHGLPDELSAAEIVSHAQADAQGHAADTVRHFWRLIARFAGDMALIFMARGGVCLSGGILPRVMSLLDEAEFRAAFEDKAPMQDVVRQIPTAMITAPDAVLLGLAALAAHPAHYALDYRERAWR